MSKRTPLTLKDTSEDYIDWLWELAKKHPDMRRGLKKLGNHLEYLVATVEDLVIDFGEEVPLKRRMGSSARHATRLERFISDWECYQSVGIFMHEEGLSEAAACRKVAPEVDMAWDSVRNARARWLRRHPEPPMRTTPIAAHRKTKVKAIANRS